MFSRVGATGFPALAIPRCGWRRAEAGSDRVTWWRESRFCRERRERGCGTGGAGFVGAGTLVTLMVKDGWAEAKKKFARPLGRRRGDARTVAAELEESRAQLAQAHARGDDKAAADVTAEWRSRLRRLLQEDANAGTLLAELVEQYGPGAPSPQRTPRSTTTRSKARPRSTRARETRPISTAPRRHERRHRRARHKYGEYRGPPQHV